jgi:hypothetical protein
VCDRYRSGIWKDDSNSTIEDIDHDVEIVGWGEEDGVKFWHVRNSWGTFWGEMGFFRVERGKDALFMENGDCWYPPLTIYNRLLPSVNPSFTQQMCRSLIINHQSPKSQSGPQSTTTP